MTVDPARDRRRCVFCDGVATSSCDWQNPKKTRVSVREVEVGDVIYSGLNSRVFRVVGLLRAAGADSAYVTVAEVRNGRAIGTHDFQWSMCGTVETLRKRPCETAACECHARDLDGNRHICAQHWRDQLEAIA